MSSIATDGFRKHWGLIKYKQEQQCETLSLTDAAEMFDFRSADLIKMDIEGGEYALVESLAEILRGTNCPSFISFHPDSIIADGDEKKAIELRIQESLRVARTFHGFDAVILRGKYLVRIDLEEMITSTMRPMTECIFIPS